MLCPKQTIVHDKKFRKSFAVMGRHKCFITGLLFTEHATESVDGAHITIGRYGKNIKHDDLIMPLRHSLHLEFDRDQPAFINKYWHMFPYNLRFEAEQTIIDNGKPNDDPINGDSYTDYRVKVIKEMAREYYKRWKET